MTHRGSSLWTHSSALRSILQTPIHSPPIPLLPFTVASVCLSLRYCPQSSWFQKFGWFETLEPVRPNPRNSAAPKAMVVHRTVNPANPPAPPPPPPPVNHHHHITDTITKRPSKRTIHTWSKTIPLRFTNRISTSSPIPLSSSSTFYAPYSTRSSWPFATSLRPAPASCTDFRAVTKHAKHRRTSNSKWSTLWSAAAAIRMRIRLTISSSSSSSCSWPHRWQVAVRRTKSLE